MRVRWLVGYRASSLSNFSDPSLIVIGEQTISADYSIVLDEYKWQANLMLDMSEGIGWNRLQKG